MKINITYEEALAKASPALRRKMEHTREVLERALPLALKYAPDEGFYVGFSGGKDSQALYHMMQLCGMPMHVYFSPTSIDPPENIRFIRTHYPEVEFVPLKENIFNLFKRMKVLPSMRIRYCCSHYKERGGEGKVVCTGVRKAESVRRSKRNEIEVSGRKFSGHMDEFEEWQEKKIRKKIKNLNQDQFSEAKESEVRCINGKDKILLNPIIEWSEQDVWSFLNDVVEVPHCELYDQGWTRIGCICCPMSSMKSTQRDIKRWPHVKDKWIRAIMDVRKESILGLTPPNATSLQSTEYNPWGGDGRKWRDELDEGLERLAESERHFALPPPQSSDSHINTPHPPRNQSEHRRIVQTAQSSFQVGASNTPECQRADADSRKSIGDWGGQSTSQRSLGREFFGRRQWRSLGCCR